MLRPLACNCLQINHKGCRLRENSDKTYVAMQWNRTGVLRLDMLKSISPCGNGRRCLSRFTPTEQSSGSHSIPLPFWLTDLRSFYLRAPLSERGRCFIQAHFLCITIDEPQREMKNKSFLDYLFFLQICEACEDILLKKRNTVYWSPLMRRPSFVCCRVLKEKNEGEWINRNNVKSNVVIKL